MGYPVLPPGPTPVSLKEQRLLAAAMDKAAGADKELNGAELAHALYAVRDQVPELKQLTHLLDCTDCRPNASLAADNIALSIEDAARLAKAHLAAKLDPESIKIPSERETNSAVLNAVVAKKVFLIDTATRVLNYR